MVSNTIDLPDSDVVALGVANDRVEVVEVVGGVFYEAEFSGDAVTGVATNGSILFGAMDCRGDSRPSVG